MNGEPAVAVVWIPSLLRGLTDGAEKVTVPGATLRQVINSLEAAYPGMRAHLLDERGVLLPAVAVAIDGDTSHLGLLQPVREDAEIHFIPAIRGG